MITFLIHTSINVRSYLLDYIKKNLSELEKETGTTISLDTPSHDHSRSWLLESISESKIPDVILTHASDFSVLETKKPNNYFSELAGKFTEDHPIRTELSIFEDPDRIFYPLFIVPMVMFYNKRILNKDELGNSWTDLFNEKRTVIFPDKDTPISKIVMAYLKKNYADEYDVFKERVTFGNSPVEVIKAVASGQYHMGISNVSFSMMAKQRGIEINWPVEGTIPLPQVLVWRKDADPVLTKIADLLTTDEIQQYLGEQGFWPVREKIQMGRAIPGDAWKNRWDGWEVFMKEIREI